jgi:DNA/RNA endonuclease G, NUC1
MKRCFLQSVFSFLVILFITIIPIELFSQSQSKVLTLANAAPISGQRVNHTYYVLGYNSSKHNPDWVAYLLTKSMVSQTNATRNNKFKTDPAAKGCATPKDYAKSGYDKGHICPAGDMAFSQKAQDMSFLMSNMAPQEPAFNRGIWKKLEEQVRDWAGQNDSIIIIAGPIYSGGTKKIGAKGVVVPDKFYKIVIDISYPTYKAIAFIIPNVSDQEDFYSFCVSIDQVESLTGLDFFPQYDSNKFIQGLEKTNNTQQW